MLIMYPFYHLASIIDSLHMKHGNVSKSASPTHLLLDTDMVQIHVGWGTRLMLANKIKKNRWV